MASKANLEAFDSPTPCKKLMKFSKVQFVLAILGIAVMAVAVFAFVPRKSKPRAVQLIGASPVSENALIDQWTATNDLNQFGDPNDTVYAGGTPLFDEATGASIDRYAYIIKNHPGRPWRVQ